MPKKIKLFIIAGEPSGDLLGGRLIHALRILEQENSLQLEIQGIGGAEMAAAGLESLIPITDLSVMGLMEVLPRIFKIKRHLKKTHHQILTFDPDIIVTIDSPGFCFRLIEGLGDKIRAKKLHYVAPTVWAWKAKRINQVARLYDRLLTLLPFEADYFKPAGIDTVFVGHSVLETNFPSHTSLKAFAITHNLPNDAKPLLILPGSRTQEVRRLLPIFGAALTKLRAKHQQNWIPLIATLPHLKNEIDSICANWPIKPIVFTNKQERLESMVVAKASIAASGTVSLELAIAGLPHLIAYRINPISYWLLRRMVNAPFVNLINILLQREIIPEYLQERCNPSLIADRLDQLINDPIACKKQQDGFEAGINKLSSPNGMTSSRAAALAVLDWERK